MSYDWTPERIQEVIAQLTAPFDYKDVKWRVTATNKDKSKGLVAPYADPRTYTQRLNDVLSPAGWTCMYTTTPIAGLMRIKDGKPVASVKIVTVATLEVYGIGTKSSMSEKWADEENAVTAAEAQSLKRAASQFGLGKYFYDIKAAGVNLWVPLDEKKVPTQTPSLPKQFLPLGANPPSSHQRPQGTQPQAQGTQQGKQPQQNDQKSAQTDNGVVMTPQQQFEAMKPKALELLGQPLFANIVFRAETAEKQGSVSGNKYAYLINYMRNTGHLLNKVKEAAADTPTGILEALLERKQVKRLDLIPNFDTLLDLAKELGVETATRQATAA